MSQLSKGDANCDEIDPVVALLRYITKWPTLNTGYKGKNMYAFPVSCLY